MSSKIDVEKVAKLARIELGAEEKEKLQKEFEGILDYVDKLSQADLSKLEAGNEPERKNILREDKSPHEGGIFSDKLMGEAPEREGDYIKVKHVFE